MRSKGGTLSGLTGDGRNFSGTQKTVAFAVNQKVINLLKTNEVKEPSSKDI